MNQLVTLGKCFLNKTEISGRIPKFHEANYIRGPVNGKGDGTFSTLLVIYQIGGYAYAYVFKESASPEPGSPSSAGINYYLVG